MGVRHLVAGSRRHRFKVMNLDSAPRWPRPPPILDTGPTGRRTRFLTLPPSDLWSSEETTHVPAGRAGQVAPAARLFASASGWRASGSAGSPAGPSTPPPLARRPMPPRSRRRFGGESRPLAGGANGGRLESFESAGGDVRVRVRVGSPHRVRCVRSGASAAGIPPGSRPNGLAPGCGRRIARAGQCARGPVPVTSGFRSGVEQRRLWDGRDANRYPFAPPGTSMHERGLPWTCRWGSPTGSGGGREGRVVPSVPDHGSGAFERVTADYLRGAVGRLGAPWLRVVAFAEWSGRSTRGRS